MANVSFVANFHKCPIVFVVQFTMNQVYMEEAYQIKYIANISPVRTSFVLLNTNIIINPPIFHKDSYRNVG